MKPTLISVPFKTESSHGLSQVDGIAKFSSAGIIIEFESKLLGLIRGEVKEVRISLDEILDIKFRKGIFRFFSQIQLRLKNISKLSELPNEGGRVKLKIKREDFERAQRAVEETLQYLHGTAANALPEAEKSDKQLPPVQTSVNELFDTKKLENKESRETNKLDNS